MKSVIVGFCRGLYAHVRGRLGRTGVAPSRNSSQPGMTEILSPRSELLRQAADMEAAPVQAERALPFLKQIC